MTSIKELTEMADGYDSTPNEFATFKDIITGQTYILMSEDRFKRLNGAVDYEDKEEEDPNDI